MFEMLGWSETNGHSISLTVDHFAYSCLIHRQRDRIIEKSNSFSPGQGRGRRENKAGIREESVGQVFIPCLNRQPAWACLKY